MSSRLTPLAACLMLAGFATSSHGAGFALVEQNASGLGNAYAGQAASAQDASTIFFNPAGMTMLPDRQLVVAGHLIQPQAEFTGSSNIGGGDGGDAGGLAVVPNAYVAYRLTPDVHVGVGMNAPFGLKTEYDSDWAGRTQGVKSELKIINLNPSIAWKASPTFSLGAGLSVQYAEATLTSRTGAAPAAGVLTVKGDDFGWGFNLGALWQASPSTRIGLAYRSEVDQKLDGSVTGAAPSPIPATASVTLPDSASLSVLHKLNNKLELLADITWTGWSDFDELRILRKSDGATLAVTTENWSDNYRYSVGANFSMSDKLTVRGGVAYDETPVSDDIYRTVRIPDQSRTWLAVGAQYRLSDKSALDFGYAHLFVKDARIPNRNESGVILNGTYEASVDILSAQFTHNF
ncbi:MAG: outer membrane protein transport protein [Thiobacillus sp.]